MTRENTVPKYSEMLMQLVEEFNEQLPDKLTFEETLEVGVDAWNLANNKDFLVSKDLYKKELESYDNHSIINKMVDFKLKEFPDFNNVIIDFSTTGNILQVKTQTQEDRFNSLIRQAINIKQR